MSASAFELLARPIQHALWDMQWRELRPIQVDAIRTTLTTEQDLLITARTASGKTEAAFLPVLSRLFEKPGESVGAMYVGPLKALINDQFRRLEALCERSKIPVHRWHGDVDDGKKKKLLNDPRGVLLITPESLESFFINRSSSLAHVFADLRYVVIDEIHSLVGRERGLQLRSQLCRLRRYTHSDFRLFGLSATVGDAVSVYQHWMRPDQPDLVTHISDPGEENRVQFGIQVYETTPQTLDPIEAVAKGASTEAKDLDAEVPSSMIADILRNFAGNKNLIFCNNRGTVEWLADSLNDECRRQQRPEEFLVHHGSVSKELRAFTEEEMRGPRAATALCSSTLELGIDIGSVKSVGQVGPCWSVNSQVQRLGRSGRRDDEAHCMRVMIPLRNQDQSDDLIDRLYRDLLQAIAITELMLQRWVEPPNISEQDLSTLVQQILSSLAEFGGMLAKPLFQHLVTRGAFRWLEPTQFASILRSLNQRGVIEQMTDGLLLLSPNGEQFVHDLDFYSVFASAQELAVRFDGRDIGNLSAMYSPKPGDHFLLAGRRWETVEVDSRRAEVTVKPAVGRKRPKFVGSGGEIHPRIRDEMRRVLTGKDEFGYLAATAKAYLDAARNAFWSANQSNSSVLHQGNNSFLWFTWTGTRIQRTLAFLAAMAGFECVDKKIALRVTGTTTEFVTSLSDCVTRLHGDAHGLIDFEITPWRKFDDCLTEDILRQPFLTEWLDLQGAKDHILELSARLSHR